MTRRADSESETQSSSVLSAYSKSEYGNAAASAVHAHLREMIIGGVLAPGTVLNQLTLAPSLGVSRTPLREAIRRLQEEGLVVAEPQKRARVASFDPELLEATYVQRIFLEGLLARMSATEASDADLAKLVAAQEDWRAVAIGSEDNSRARTRANRRFHLAFEADVGPSLRASIEQLMDRSDHWMLSAVDGSRAARGYEIVEAEHMAIIDSVRERDGHAAAVAMTRHLTGSLFALLDRLAPDYVPTAARTAAAMATGRRRHSRR